MSTRKVSRGMGESIEKLREALEGKGDEDGNVTFAGGIILNVEDAGDYEVVDEEYEGEEDGPRPDGQGDIDETNEEWNARFGIDDDYIEEEDDDP